MLAVELRFPAGRYHATPWYKDVNEGVPEWPPSSWRFLRALIALAHGNGMAEDELFHRIIHKLASEPPSYCVPRAYAAHTRHYMPLYKPGKTAKVFDTFVVVAKNDPLVMVWPATVLDRDERQMVCRLLSCLAYLGRAESWVEARILNDWDGGINVYPANGDHTTDASNVSPWHVLPLKPWQSSTQAEKRKCPSEGKGVSPGYMSPHPSLMPCMPIQETSRNRAGAGRQDLSWWTISGQGIVFRWSTNCGKAGQ